MDRPSFTPGEIEILRYFIEHRGAPQKEVAHALGKSIRTVQSHMYRIHRKAGTASPAQLMDWCHQHRELWDRRESQ